MLGALLSSGCDGSELVAGAHREDATTAGAAGGPQAPQDPAACEVTSVPPLLDVPSFYAAYTDAAGIPVLASAEVDTRALTIACRIVVGMLSKRDDVHQQMIERGAKVAVIGERQSILDLPGFEFVSDATYRSHGPLVDRPWIGAAEENLLCSANDANQGESLLVHSFAHGLRVLGIELLEPDFAERLADIYEAAMAAGKWQSTFAARNAGQYFAEGVQSWFDANRYVSPRDGLHGEVATHEALREYDEALFSLIDGYLPRDRAFSLCP